MTLRTPIDRTWDRIQQWRRKRKKEIEAKNGGVFKRDNCLFKYCPHPSRCLSICSNEIMQEKIDRVVEDMKAKDALKCRFCHGSGLASVRLAPNGWATGPCARCDGTGLRESTVHGELTIPSKETQNGR